jgi:hypothetical protein
LTWAAGLLQAQMMEISAIVLPIRTPAIYAKRRRRANRYLGAYLPTGAVDIPRRSLRAPMPAM